jgi:hypothetical protein
MASATAEASAPEGTMAAKDLLHLLTNTGIRSRLFAIGPGAMALTVMLRPHEEHLYKQTRRLAERHGYISRDQYLANRQRLAAGLLICRFCRHRLTVRYKNNGDQRPIYQCD